MVVSTDKVFLHFPFFSLSVSAVFTSCTHIAQTHFDKICFKFVCLFVSFDKALVTSG